jgi:hypothetical protein
VVSREAEELRRMLSQLDASCGDAERARSLMGRSYNRAKDCLWHDQVTQPPAFLAFANPFHFPQTNTFGLFSWSGMWARVYCPVGRHLQFGTAGG